MKETLLLADSTIDVNAKMVLEFERAIEADAAFTERFARKIFFDAVYCFRRFIKDIRPHRAGSARPPATMPLDAAPAQLTAEAVVIDGQQVMHVWETILMRKMAQAVCREGDIVLEVGFGLGISAREIQTLRPRRHVIVEANGDVVESARKWRSRHDSQIEIIHSRWEDLDFEPSTFDSIFFDAYPSDEQEIWHNLQLGRRAAEKFFPAAERFCRAGGRFTFYTGCEIGLLLRLQDELFRRFGQISLERVSGLAPPMDCNYWIAPEMVVVVARKGSCLKLHLV